MNSLDENKKFAFVSLLVFAIYAVVLNQVAYIQISPLSSPARVSPQVCTVIQDVDPLARRDKNVTDKVRQSFRAENENFKGQKATSVTLSQLEKRKANLVALMRGDPDAAAEELFTPEPINSLFTQTTKNCAEEQFDDVGTISILHADYPDNTATFLYVFHGEKSGDVTLHIPSSLVNRVTPDAFVKISGKRLDTDVLVNPKVEDNLVEAPKSGGGGRPTKGSGGSTTPVISATGTAPQPTLVVVASFQGGTKPSISKSTIDNIVFGQVSNYYHQTSYGIVSIPGVSYVDVQFTIAPTCSIYFTMNEVVKALDAQVNFMDYQNIVVVAPFPCSWGGVSWVGKSALWTADGNANVGQVLISSGMADKRVIGHELGHAIGSHHAGFLYCGSATFPTDLYYGGCTMSEYGDPYEIMGLGFGEMNAPHRAYFGWLRPENIQRVTESGTYTIEPLEGKSNNVKVLRIPRSGNEYTDLYVEYRQPIGDDKGFVQNVYSGPIIHFPAGAQPQLLDATPPSDTSSPALSVGKTVIDPLTGVTITTMSADSSGTTMKITLGKSDFQAPNITSITPAYGALVSGVMPVSIDVSDSSGISRVEYKNQAATTPFAVVTAAPWTANWDTTILSNGPQNIVITAYDNAGAPYGAVNNVVATYQQYQVSN
jgi:hypothetical protein